MIKIHISITTRTAVITGAHNSVNYKHTDLIIKLYRLKHGLVRPRVLKQTIETL